ncbi:MAG: transaldolase [Sulfurospirillum sp.]|nr:transaldolase [Sulfurospirillum sp.]
MLYEKIKFSLWCDFVERKFIGEEFVSLIEQGVINGATSNPAIFKSSFLNSSAYLQDRQALSGKDPKTVYETLAIADIKAAAQKLQALYANDKDGFISIEVDPFLCDDAKGTIEEARRLYESIGEPNVMIKVPATDAGYEAMEELMSEGMHINATLIFSPKQAKSVAEAFKRATIRCAENHEDIKTPQGVISVFVSRFDTKLDAKLASLGMRESRVGIMNALRIYDLIESFGLKNIRTLFASTGTKRDDLPKDYYIKELLLPHAINTAPLETIKYFLTCKDIAIKTLDKQYEPFFTALQEAGVDMQNVYDTLMQEGLQSFRDAFKQILAEL